jgi:hypothetical protein
MPARNPTPTPLRAIVSIFLVIEQRKCLLYENFMGPGRAVKEHDVVFEDQTFHLLAVMAVPENLGVFGAVVVVCASLAAVALYGPWLRVELFVLQRRTCRAILYIGNEDNGLGLEGGGYGRSEAIA